MRLLWASGIDGFCHRYEVLHRAEAARLLGARSAIRHFTDPRLLREVERADVLLLYRTPATPLVAALIARARRLRVPVVGTIDDLIFVPEPGFLPALEHLDRNERALWVDGVRRYRAVLDDCDGFIAPTEPLLEVARDLGWRAWLHRDALSASELALADEALRRQRARGAADARAPRGRREFGGARPVVLGYFSGSPTHDRDFAVLAPALAAVLAAQPAVRLRIVGPLRLGPELAPFADRVERRPAVRWVDLPGLIAGVDVNLAPLELASRFATAKGEVKYLEAAAVAVPTIASPTPAFRHAIRNGETGFLAADERAWRDAIGALARDVALRRRIGRAARRDVEERFAPAVRARELGAILRDAARIARRDPSPPAPLAAAAPARGGGAPGGASGPRPRVALLDDARLALELPPGAEVSPPLGAGDRIEQEIVVDAPLAYRVDLFPVTYGQSLGHRIRVRLLRADGSLVCERRRAAAQAPDRAWWAFSWRAGRLRAGERCRLRIEVDAPRIDRALSFALAAPCAALADEAATARLADASFGDGALGAPLALRAFAAWSRGEAGEPPDRAQRPAPARPRRGT